MECYKVRDRKVILSIPSHLGLDDKVCLLEIKCCLPCASIVKKHDRVEKGENKQAKEKLAAKGGARWLMR